MTPLNHPTVLVADDDRLLRESLCDYLSELGCMSRSAGNGGEAIEVMERSRFDLLMSDVDMPDMSGFQLMFWVQAHHPMPTVLMSARADPAMRQAARHAGALDLLRKPVEIASISSLFHSLFDQHPPLS
jgi:CheY-like chemotaxis protein